MQIVVQVRQSKVNRHLFSASYEMNTLIKRSDMTCDSKEITQFNLPLTQEPIPAFTSQPHSINALLVGTHGGMAWLSWSGWLWLVIYWDRFSCIKSWTPDMVTHSSTKRAQRRATSLINTNVLPLSQTATTQSGVKMKFNTLAPEAHYEQSWLHCCRPQ